MTAQIRAFSSGGGVQSTAALVLSATRRIDFPVHLFANVGTDSENPDTLRYVHDVLMPYAADNDIVFHELHRVRRDGAHATLLTELQDSDKRSIPIPVFMWNGAPGTRRCSKDFKISVAARWLREAGATKQNPAVVGIGFSTDEMHRIGRAVEQSGRLTEYPLIDLGLSRTDCAKVIQEAGLPQAPKSACWFCPMHPPKVWAVRRRDKPEIFWDAVALEATINAKRASLSCPGEGMDPLRAGDANPEGYCPKCHASTLVDENGKIPAHGKSDVFLTSKGKPLDQAIGEAQPTLFGEDDGWGGSCDEGTCFI